MKTTKLFTSLLSTLGLAIALSACGDIQSQYDACLDNPELCESSDDALTAANAEAAGNSCSATSKDGTKSCQVTCPSWEQALCSSTQTSATCVCQAATPPPKDTSVAGLGE